MSLRRFVLSPSRVILALLALGFALGLKVPQWLEYAPFLLSLVLLGLPHGAVDHLVPDRLSGRAATTRSVTAIVFLYFTLGSFYLLFWFLAPSAAFVFFIVLTWFHWGQGDLHALAVLEDRPRDLFDGIGTILTRGGLPMLVPLISHPEVYRDVFLNVSGIFGGGPSGIFYWAFEPPFRAAAGLALATVVAILFSKRIIENYRRKQDFPTNEALETILLVVYFVLVPPVLAVGVYFCVWHATRHIARLALLDENSRESLERGRFWSAVGSFVRDAAPLTGAALLMLVGLYFALPVGRLEVGSLLGVYLVLISVLTLPHVVIVSYMDYRQNVWH